MSIFRPSVQALFWLRVDELESTDVFDRLVAAQASGEGDIAGGVSTQPTVTAEQLSDPARAIDDIVASRLQLEQNVKDGVLSLESYEIARRRLEAERELVLAAQQQPDDQPRPWMLLGASPDARYGRFGVQPLSCEIERNGFRTADTARMSIDWRVLPFDPRIIRAAAVEIVIGVVDDERFVDGIAGEVDPETGLPISVIDQNPAAPLAESTTRFCGWIDEWGSTFDESFEIELAMRDFTALFLDTPLLSTATINLDLPIDKGIATMLAEYPTLAGFPVRYIAVPGQPETAPAPRLGSSVPITSRSRRGRNARSVRSGSQSMNLWDHITDVCVALGLVPVVVDYELHIISPISQYRTQEVRRMVFGRNLGHLEYSRKLGGTKVPTIEVRAYDPTIGRVRWARWPVRAGERGAGVLGIDPPPRALRANEMTPSGARAEERIQTYVLQPSTDPTLMLAAARSLFEQIGRQEIEGNLETMDVASWDILNDSPGDTVKADMLRVRNGDALEILVAPTNLERPELSATAPSEWVGLERAARVRFLVEEIGVPQPVAERIAALQDIVSQLLFRVQDVQIMFDVDEGLKIKVSFANFIEVRETARAVTSRAAAAVTASPAAQRAALQADFDQVINEILKTSEDRISATQQAATGEAVEGLPTTSTTTLDERIRRLVEEEIAANQLGGD